jgi:hypothetical protein
MLGTSINGSNYYDADWHAVGTASSWTKDGTMSSIGVLAAAVGPALQSESSTTTGSQTSPTVYVSRLESCSRLISNYTQHI